jgi:ABC-type uncharacterized transport system ATPase subunit
VVDTVVAISVDGLTRTFGDVTAVDDLSLIVEDGEIFRLLRNGGKRYAACDCRFHRFQMSIVRS